MSFDNDLNGKFVKLKKFHDPSTVGENHCCIFTLLVLLLVILIWLLSLILRYQVFLLGNTDADRSNIKNWLYTGNSSLRAVSYILESTANGLTNTESLLTVTIGSLYATTGVAALASRRQFIRWFPWFYYRSCQGKKLASAGQLKSEEVLWSVSKYYRCIFYEHIDI